MVASAITGGDRRRSGHQTVVTYGRGRQQGNRAPAQADRRAPEAATIEGITSSGSSRKCSAFLIASRADRLRLQPLFIYNALASYYIYIIYIVIYYSMLLFLVYILLRVIYIYAQHPPRI